MAVIVPSPTPRRGIGAAGVLLALVIAAALLTWAKWAPYAGKAIAAADTGTWDGSNILEVGGVSAGDPPSWHAAVDFTRTYVDAIWKALVAALLISAAVQTLVPRAWLLRVMTRDTRVGSAVAGGLLSTPSMMCTCCTAPVAATLRRSGVPTAAAVAYWLGNPLLNPAVLVFLAFVAPWPWTVTRLVVGVLVVVIGAVLVARLTDRRSIPATSLPEPEVADRAWLRSAPRRYVVGLARLCIVLVPEYLLVVMAVGAFRGWLFPVGDGGISTGVAAVAVATVVGTLVVIPTAGEIPIAQGLALAGLGAGPVGALLVTLPAVSLPGMVMVGRAFGWSTTTLTALVAAAGGLVGALLLAIL
jgi:uncharacterized membrane protein YraQ (UPF0718 family)